MAPYTPRNPTATGWCVGLALIALLLAAPPALRAAERGGPGKPDLCEQVLKTQRALSPGRFSGPPPPPDEVLEANGAVIGEIRLVPVEVFDTSQPGENRLVYRTANRLHPSTRPHVLERKLLFASGEPYRRRVLDETERALRDLDYLYDACVEPLFYRDNRVDVLVVTRDVWTLGLSGGFQRAGEGNTLSFQVEDTNFLGTGRMVSLKWISDPDRQNYRLRFFEPHVRGSRISARLLASRLSDGHRHTLDVERPFFSLDTTWSAGTRLVTDERIDRIYSTGELVNGFNHQNRYVGLYGGVSRGHLGGRTMRLLFGYTYDEHSFFAAPDFIDASEPPEPRTLSYPWIGVESIEDEFFTAQNVNRIGRTEDFNLGTSFRARLGFTSDAWGGDRDQAIVEADFGTGRAIGERQFFLVTGHASGRVGDGGSENVLIGAGLRYYFRNLGPHQLFATVHAATSRRLDPERQLLLGGDTGLRGYPRNYADGEHRFLISIEQRFYTNLELFKLLHVGAAVFFDAGRAWYSDATPDRGLLRDVGAGLRLSSSRSSKGAMVHLDVAFPLDGDSRKVQWLVTSSETF